MHNILLLHGANLNFLGKRDPNHYGHLTLETLEKFVIDHAFKINFNVIVYQSNHEGCIIDKIQNLAPECHGIIINPGAFTHYSYAIHDAIIDSNLPTIEVHLSDIENRESWRKNSVIAPACIATISGKKEIGYLEALEKLTERLNGN